MAARPHTSRHSFLICPRWCFIAAAVTVMLALSATLFAGPTTSLVYPGDDGRLTYVPDEQGNIIPDFSHAGYEGGGVPLPEVPVKITLEPGEGDNAMVIQSAIDRLAQMPRDENGFRGAILLTKGFYELTKPLIIHASGIVLRGEGDGPDGTTLYGWGKDGTNGGCRVMFTSNMIIVHGRAAAEPVPGSARNITDDYVPVGTRSFTVEHTRGLNIGDTVIVRRHGNHGWIHFIGNDNAVDDVTEIAPKIQDAERIITAIKGNTVTIDAPIVCPIETRWGGGELLKYTDDRRLDHIGFENLRGVSGYDPTVKTTEYLQTELTGPEYMNDEDHYWNFIWIENAKNCWVRDVTGLHFARALAQVGPGGKWVTIQDCGMWEYVSMLQGCRRSAFGMDGQLCLTQRCETDMGRHDFFIGGSHTSGPNVFLDCTAGLSYSSSEPHGSFGYGMLYDNVVAPITLRFYKRTTHVWGALFSTNWNCEGYFLVQQPPGAQNYAFGQIGEYTMIHNRHLMDFTLEPGHIEHHGTHVSPRSLYLKQLEDRLGEDAVRAIAADWQLTE